jgi:hypothetical protein
LTEKDFETPFGVIKSDREGVRALQKAGRDVVSPHDFVHRAEHSIEFQTLFLAHLWEDAPFTLVPILCGSLKGTLPEYRREAYLQRAGAFLKVLADLLLDPLQETLLVAGVDFSHIGMKFGHQMDAAALLNEALAHDRRLLEALSQRDPTGFWEESIRVDDRYNVCGFSAMACLLEVLPFSQGRILDYQTWQEEPTRSAVSFAAAAFSASH